jgi:hypothetical protein
MPKNDDALSRAYAAKLAESGITQEVAKLAKFKLYTAEQVASKLPKLFPNNLGGFQLPYFSMEGKMNCHYRFRFLEQPGGWIGATDKKVPRYSQPVGSRIDVYWPQIPGMPWKVIADNPEVPLIITEGELKSICASMRGFATIGLGGVNMFSDSRHQKMLIDALEAITWQGRDVFIIYDSDTATNLDVRRAEYMLCRALLDRDAHVYPIRLPNIGDGKKMGLDDYLMHPQGGAENLQELINRVDEHESSVELHKLASEVMYIQKANVVYEPKNDLRMTPDAFVRSHYAHRMYLTRDGDRVVKKKAAKEFMEWPARTELIAFTFAPGAEQIIDSKYYNVWAGWPYEPKKGAVDSFHKLLDNVFATQPKEYRHWFLQWCAYPIQNPGTKLKQAVILWGGQGSGKSFLLEAVRRLYGRHGTTITNEQLESPFTEWQEGKQFVIGEEITSGTHDKKAISEKLKFLITSSEVAVNRKYQTAYELPNRMNLALVSNNAVPVRIEEDDRRYFVINVRGSNIAYDKAYDIPTIDTWAHSDEGMQALMYYMLHYDVTGFDPNRPPPFTEDKRELVHHSSSEHHGWLTQLRDDPDSLLQINHVPFRYDLVTAQDIHNLFKRHHEGSSVTANTIAGALAQLKFIRGYPGVVRTAQGAKRIWVLRNHDKYKKMGASDIGREYDKQHNFDPKKFQK